MRLEDIKHYDLPALPADSSTQIQSAIEEQKRVLDNLGIGEVWETSKLELMNDGICFAVYQNSAMSLPEGVHGEADKFTAYRPALLNGRAFRYVPQNPFAFSSGALYWVFDSDNPRWVLKWYTDVQKISLYALKSYNLDIGLVARIANA